jgi:hypothetical protein
MAPPKRARTSSMSGGSGVWRWCERIVDVPAIKVHDAVLSK